MEKEGEKGKDIICPIKMLEIFSYSQQDVTFCAQNFEYHRLLVVRHTVIMA